MPDQPLLPPIPPSGRPQAAAPQPRPAPVLQVLSPVQTVLLHCIRTWVSTPSERGAAVAEALGRLDAAEAAPFLENFMIALLHAARRAVAIGPAGQTRVGPDERLLLGILAFAQEGRPAEALLLLRGLVRTEGARLVLRNAEGLATELALSGRYLSAADLALPPATLPPNTLPPNTLPQNTLRSSTLPSNGLPPNTLH